ncbi:ZIP family transporter [Dethiosulfatarculus sandiegensis]|uniref:Iron permease n=1 Tax=Dethiosulfatarculus sandiegensis TaxID=1429043 RepID=A0A0D2G7G0_9BACT|nr:ZIP family metal transporter [Dethiosulfatarculus sandiegensis]KIX10897.1 iron permease [Dethiosulfatarculus sandiegensis]
MLPLEIKLAAIALIFLTGIAGGWTALKAHGQKSSQAFFNLGACLGAGVFLGAGLIHLLPDSFEAMREINPDLGYPLPALLAGCSVLLVLLLEKVVVNQDKQETAKGMSAYTLMLVLSIHSFVAGAALGVESGAVSSLALLLAILAHKGSAAFALTVALVRARLPRPKTWGMLVLFSVSTPLGVTAGILGGLALNQGSARIFEMIFDALAAGTFFYIALSDVLADEFMNAPKRGPAFLLTAVGLGIMALVALWL